MNQKCEKFIDLLADEEISSADQEFLTRHASECRECQTLLQSHQALVQQLEKMSELPADSQSRLYQKIRGHISVKSPAVTKSPIAGLLDLLSSFRFAVSMAVILLIAIIFMFSGNRAAKFAATGNGILMIGSEQVALGDAPEMLGIDETVSLQQGSVRLAWQNDDRVKITGQLDFSLQKNTLKVNSGVAAFDFQPSAVGYRVLTPGLQLTIVGTSISYSMNNGIEQVEVIRGKITWKLHDGSKSGSLAAGSGIRLLPGAVVEELKQLSPSDAKPVSQSVLIPDAHITEPDQVREPDLFDATEQ